MPSLIKQQENKRKNKDMSTRAYTETQPCSIKGYERTWLRNGHQGHTIFIFL